MNARLLFAACLAAAGTAHWVALPLSDTGVAGADGAQGADTLSVLASDGALTDLVAAWQRPPTVETVQNAVEMGETVESLPRVAEPTNPVALAMPQPRFDLPSDPSDRPFLEPSAPHLAQAAQSPRGVDGAEPSLIDPLPDMPTVTPSHSTLTRLPSLQPLAAEPGEQAFTAPPPPPQPVAEPVPMPPPPQRPADLTAPATPQPQRPAPTARPAPAPAPATAARTAQGGDSGTAAGTHRQSPDPGRAAQQADALATWGARIRAQIERQRRRVSGSGRVTLVLRVSTQGRLESVRIAQGSGSDALDNAAISAAQRGGRFPQAPEILGSAAHDFRITLRFGRS
jgi:protein TonB